MLTLSSYVTAASQGSLDRTLALMYGRNALPVQRQRLQMLLRRMETWVGEGKIALVSAPGRTELGGNHTDHNNGVVLAAAVDFDCLAAAMPTGDNAIRIRSEGFAGVIEVDLGDLSPRKDEEGTSAGIIRGVAYGFEKAGHSLGAFDACIAGNVPVGAGLSSSAAFEVCIGQIFNHVFNGGLVPAIDIARIGRQAENLHFGKPCGFMDQLACAEQGILSIDFMNQNKPTVTEIDFDFSSTGYQLAVVDTGGSHADLTPEYAAIPGEMGQAAGALGQSVARGLTLNQVLASASDIRREAGDRALLRLIHFIEENGRAMLQAEMLEHGEMREYLRLVNLSGDSSWRLLQNCISTANPLEQPIPLALTLTERFLEGKGAWRIQGGGFAGTIQAYVPKGRFEEYRAFMESVFGGGAVLPLRIRKPGLDLVLPDAAGGLS